MKRSNRRRPLLPSAYGLLPVFLLAFALVPASTIMPVDAAGSGPAREQIIWDGEIFLNDTVSILSNQTLVIRPGSVVHIKGVAASCTEGNLPILEINGSIRAEGTPERPVAFVSGEDMPDCTGREALVIYTRDPDITSILSCVRFFGGNLLLSGISASMSGCSFNWTYLDIGDDRSVIENCTFIDSPVNFHTASRTVISNCTFERTEQDEIGIHLSSGVSILRSRISGCIFGLEATLGTAASVQDSLVSGCTEGVHSMGNLSVSNNTFRDNVVAVNSTAGYDTVRGNMIFDNDVGVVTFGDPASFLCNTFQSNGSRNGKADIQQKLLVQGDVVDGNGLALRAAVSINGSYGGLLFEGDPSYVVLTRYERLADGSGRTYAPFTAHTEMKGDSDTAVFDGSYRANFTLRLGNLLPQLTVAGLVGPKAGTRPDDEVLLNVTVRNTGDVAAGHFVVQLSVDSKPYLSRPVWGLGAGSETNISFRWTASEGAHRFTVNADWGPNMNYTNGTGEVLETDEGDNDLSLRADINAAPSLPPVPTGLMMLLLIGAGGAAMLAGKKTGNPWSR